jgi:hypothetical protein
MSWALSVAADLMLFELGLATADLILSELGLVTEDSFLSEWVGSSQSLRTRFYLS